MTVYLKRYALLILMVPGFFFTTEVSAQSSDYALSVSPTIVAPGSTITVSWQAPSTHSTKDWIGLFVAGLPSSSATRIALKYVPSGTSGTLAFVMPNTQNKQTYELRYLLNGGSTEAARSSAITVTRAASTTGSTSQPATTPSSPPSYSLNAGPVTVAPGSPITVTWTAPSGHSAQDWVGLFVSNLSSASNTKLAVKYVPAGTSGTLTFIAPNTLLKQTYQLRYLLNGGFTEAARSNSITVTTATSSTSTPSSTPTSASTSSTTSPTSPSTALTVGVIGLAPSMLSFNGTAGGSNPVAQPINVSNTSTGALLWTASDNANWLTLSPTTGTNVGTIMASVNSSGLAAGTYNATVTVSAAGATAKTLPVTLTLTSASTGTAALSWTANTESDLAGYKVYMGTQSGVYGAPITLGKVSTYQAANLKMGTTYFFSISAYDTAGNESPHSVEVSRSIY